MGIRFVLDSGAQTRLTAIVDKLERRFIEGTLPDDCLL
jgi:hypothetical protein